MQDDLLKMEDWANTKVILILTNMKHYKSNQLK